MTTVAQQRLLPRSSTQETDSAATTRLTVSAPTSLALQRLRRRRRLWTASQLGLADEQRPQLAMHPSLYIMILGPAGPLDHLPASNTPPRVPRSRPIPSTAATPASTSSLVPAVPIQFDRYRAEPIGTPLLRLPPTPGDMPIAPTKLEALGDVGTPQFADPVPRFSHAD